MIHKASLIYVDGSSDLNIFGGRFFYLRTVNAMIMANKEDRFQGVDYYSLDDLLTEEHKLIRDAARAWVKTRAC